jgi:hypothetical protein
LAYQPPASSTFLSQQTSHQQSVSSTFLLEQTSQPNRLCIGKKKNTVSSVETSRSQRGTC